MNTIELLRYKLYEAIKRNDKKEMLKISQKLDEKIIEIMKSRYK